MDVCTYAMIHALRHYFGVHYLLVFFQGMMFRAYRKKAREGEDCVNACGRCIYLDGDFRGPAF